MSAVTLTLLKAHANIDHSADDEILQHYLDTAESWIVNHTGNLIDAPPLKQAALMLASYFYEQREAIGDAIDAVPFGVLDLIRPYRHWSFTDA